jgi:hypothetical protein
MLPPPYPVTLKLGDVAAAPREPTHWEPIVILGAGALTIGGLIFQARGAKDVGTLLYVTAILGATITAALRCYSK